MIRVPMSGFYEVLENQRLHARVLPWLGTGRHSVHLVGVPAEPRPCPPPWEMYQLELVDARSTAPTIGSIIVAIPDWCYEPSRRKERTNFPPAYLLYRIVEIHRSGGLTLDRHHFPGIHRHSRRSLDPMMPRDRRCSSWGDGVTIIEGTVQNVVELGFAEVSPAPFTKDFAEWSDREFLSDLGITPPRSDRRDRP